MSTSRMTANTTHKPPSAIAKLIRMVFTIALLGTTLTGITLVLLQIVAAAAGRASLVISLHDRLVPAAAIMAAVVCVSS